eukprot:COSAG01_NODE_452_length_16879_cov_474.367223_8_plen_427_part_00
MGAGAQHISPAASFEFVHASSSSYQRLVALQGDHFPQLSHREIVDTAKRYLAALKHEVLRGRSLQELQDGQDLQDALHEVAGRSSLSTPDPGATAARDLLNLLRQHNFGGQHAGIVSLSVSVRKLLHDEAVKFDTALEKSRAKSLIKEVESCRPHAIIDARPPDTQKLLVLQHEHFRCNEELISTVQEYERLERRMDQWKTTNRSQALPIEYSQEDMELQKRRRSARKELRTASQKLDKEKQRLAQLGAKHWPELLNAAPSLAAFKKMGYMSSATSSLTLNSFDIQGDIIGGRNKVMHATLDGQECVLKQYDLTGTTLEVVEREVTLLHKLRHPNIINITGVFHDQQARTHLYVQMQYLKGGNLKQWLTHHGPNPRFRQPPLSTQARRLMIGVLHAVARVHEFGMTHNDVRNVAYVCADCLVPIGC